MKDKDITGEIVVYLPDEITRLEVRVERDCMADAGADCTIVWGNAACYFQTYP